MYDVLGLDWRSAFSAQENGWLVEKLRSSCSNARTYWPISSSFHSKKPQAKKIFRKKWKNEKISSPKSLFLGLYFEDKASTKVVRSKIVR
jgi:hypothetical protein